MTSVHLVVSLIISCIASNTLVVTSNAFSAVPIENLSPGTADGSWQFGYLVGEYNLFKIATSCSFIFHTSFI